MDDHRGFTLIELMCFIAVLAILSLIAVPEVMGSIDKWILDSTARQIAEDIRWTQHLAITGCISHNFDLNISNRSYRIRSAILSDPTIKTVEFNPNIASISSTFKSQGNYKRLSFSSTGIPAQTGSIVLTSKKDKEVTITVAVGTGRVAIKP